ADDQVKIAGRRVELGEVDAALQALPGVAIAAVAVRATPGGAQVLGGYGGAVAGGEFDFRRAAAAVRRGVPATIVPRLAVVEALPTRTSGKVDRAALPWPLPTAGGRAARWSGTTGWLAECWSELLGGPVDRLDDDFFATGGSSLSAAKLVSVL